MDDKASSPCLKTRSTHRSRHSKSMDNISRIDSIIHLFRYIHICDRDLPLSFQVPCSIDNAMHTLHGSLIVQLPRVENSCMRTRALEVYTSGFLVPYQYCHQDFIVHVTSTYHPWLYFSTLQAHQAACWSCPVVAPFCTGYSPACPEQFPVEELQERESHNKTSTNALCL